MAVSRAKIVQIVPFYQDAMRGEPSGFFGLDANGAMWRTELQGSGEQRSVHWIRLQEQ